MEFEQSNADFYYRTWMREGRPKPFDEWMKDRQQPLPKKGRIFEPQTAEEHRAYSEWEAGQDARP